jgi:hypothetical protein
MSEALQPVSSPKAMLWAGRAISVIVAALMIFSGIMKVVLPAGAIEGFTHLGWMVEVALGLAIAEIGSAVLYLIPQTAVLGAILLTGYLGGAIAAHVRIGENFLAPALIGVLVWLGLYLRDATLRALIPIRWLS